MQSTELLKQQTPTVACTLQRTRETMAVLLAYGAGANNASTLVGAADLHDAARSKVNTNFLDILAKLNSVTNAGGIVLHFAAKDGCADIIAELLERGESTNAKTISVWSVLRTAVMRDHEPIVRM